MGTGSVSVIVGPMFSGKTEELIRRVRWARATRQQVQVFKPATDTRYASQEIVSHDGTRIEAVSVESAAQLWRLVRPGTAVVAIDEAQFFDDDIVMLCERLANWGIQVIVAGLDMDFRGEPFGPVPTLMARATRVDKLQAVCVVCGRPASYTQRLIDGRPAAHDTPTILVGGREIYEPRCRKCHVCLLKGEP